MAPSSLLSSRDGCLGAPIVIHTPVSSAIVRHLAARLGSLSEGESNAKGERMIWFDVAIV